MIAYAIPLFALSQVLSTVAGMHYQAGLPYAGWLGLLSAVLGVGALFVVAP
jgi:hypothetical protein